MLAAVGVDAEFEPLVGAGGAETGLEVEEFIGSGVIGLTGFVGSSGVDVVEDPGNRAFHGGVGDIDGAVEGACLDQPGVALLGRDRAGGEVVPCVIGQ